MSISFRSSGKPLGCEVIGVDLAKDRSADIARQVEEILVANSVVVLRNQNITPAQHVEFGKHFGITERHIGTAYSLPEAPEIHIVSNIVENGRNIGVSDAGMFWHSDGIYKNVTNKYSLLYAIEVPVIDGVARGDTLFASTFAAYDALSEERKRQCAGLQAIYSYGNFYDMRRNDINKKLVELKSEQRTKVPDIMHPIIRTHPVSGRKCIYIADGTSVGVEGMETDAGMALLKELMDHCTQPQFVYTHKWQVGDLVIWDNCSSLHKATLTDYALPHRRRMHRVTITGSVPY